jgi:hypothetical protein
MMMAHGIMPLGIMPIAATAEFVGIGVALLLAGVLLAVSLVLIRLWIPQLAHIDRGYDEHSGPLAPSPSLDGSRPADASRPVAASRSADASRSIDVD